MNRTSPALSTASGRICLRSRRTSRVAHASRSRLCRPPMEIWRRLPSPVCTSCSKRLLTAGLVASDAARRHSLLNERLSDHNSQTQSAFEAVQGDLIATREDIETTAREVQQDVRPSTRRPTLIIPSSTTTLPFSAHSTSRPPPRTRRCRRPSLHISPLRSCRTSLPAQHRSSDCPRVPSSTRRSGRKRESSAR